MTAAALVLIDIQQGFSDPYWGTRNNPDFEQHVTELLAHWRKRGLPVYHVQHLSKEEKSPLRPDRAGVAFMPYALPLPHEPVIQKHVNSAFIGTNLEEILRKEKLTTLVLAGLTTDHCVSTSTRMAGNLGFKAFVPSDATATFDRQGSDGRNFDADTIHAVSLASLHNEFATVLKTQEIISRNGG
jgi:nicotinamidase-related amidase